MINVYPVCAFFSFGRLGAHALGRLFVLSLNVSRETLGATCLHYR